MPRSPLRWGVLPSTNQPMRMHRCLSVGRVLHAIRRQAEKKTGKLALNDVRRRTGKQLRVPVPRDCLCLKNRQAGFKLHHHNSRRSHRHRRGRMQHNAERAMVRIRIHRVDVDHLNHCEQRQKHQTNDGRKRQSLPLRPPISAKKCLRTSEHTNPAALRIHIFGCIAMQNGYCLGFLLDQ